MTRNTNHLPDLLALYSSEEVIQAMLAAEKLREKPKNCMTATSFTLKGMEYHGNYGGRLKYPHSGAGLYYRFVEVPFAIQHHDGSFTPMPGVECRWD